MVAVVAVLVGSMAVINESYSVADDQSSYDEQLKKYEANVVYLYDGSNISLPEGAVQGVNLFTEFSEAYENVGSPGTIYFLTDFEAKPDDSLNIGVYNNTGQDKDVLITSFDVRHICSIVEDKYLNKKTFL